MLDCTCFSCTSHRPLRFLFFSKRIGFSWRDLAMAKAEKATRVPSMEETLLEEVVKEGEREIGERSGVKETGMLHARMIIF